MDSTKKMVRKLAGYSSGTASWVKNVGNERGEVILYVPNARAAEILDIVFREGAAATNRFVEEKSTEDGVLIYQAAKLGMALLIRSVEDATRKGMGKGHWEFGLGFLGERVSNNCMPHSTTSRGHSVEQRTQWSKFNPTERGSTTATEAVKEAVKISQGIVRSIPFGRETKHEAARKRVNKTDLPYTEDIRWNYWHNVGIQPGAPEEQLQRATKEWAEEKVGIPADDVAIGSEVMDKVLSLIDAHRHMPHKRTLRRAITAMSVTETSAWNQPPATSGEAPEPFAVRKAVATKSNNYEGELEGLILAI
ncbi:hypothetical protein Bbelb_200460 [Branchiostoma belcheri]|nr:hypothetical protein Bbelb_200460 [Branchiostoma belcheri]